MTIGGGSAMIVKGWCQISLALPLDCHGQFISMLLYPKSECVALSSVIMSEDVSTLMLGISLSVSSLWNMLSTFLFPPQHDITAYQKPPVTLWVLDCDFGPYGMKLEVLRPSQLETGSCKGLKSQTTHQCLPYVFPLLTILLLNTNCRLLSLILDDSFSLLTCWFIQCLAVHSSSLVYR